MLESLARSKKVSEELGFDKKVEEKSTPADIDTQVVHAYENEKGDKGFYRFDPENKDFRLTEIQDGDVIKNQAGEYYEYLGQDTFSPINTKDIEPEYAIKYRNKIPKMSREDQLAEADRRFSLGIPNTKAGGILNFLTDIVPIAQSAKSLLKTWKTLESVGAATKESVDQAAKWMAEKPTDPEKIIQALATGESPKSISVLRDVIDAGVNLTSATMLAPKPKDEKVDAVMSKLLKSSDEIDKVRDRIYGNLNKIIPTGETTLNFLGDALMDVSNLIPILGAVKGSKALGKIPKGVLDAFEVIDKSSDTVKFANVSENIAKAIKENPLINEILKKRAFFIYEKRAAKGIEGTAQTDWNKATKWIESELKTHGGQKKIATEMIEMNSEGVEDLLIKNINDIRDISIAAKQAGVDPDLLAKLPVDNAIDIIKVFKDYDRLSDGRFLAYARNPTNVIADFFQSKASPLLEAADKGFREWNTITNDARERIDTAKQLLIKKYGEPKKLTSRVKNYSKGFQDAEQRVYDALRNRKNADKIVGTEGVDRQVYDIVVKLYDDFKSMREGKNLAVRVDYVNAMSKALQGTKKAAPSKGMVTQEAKGAVNEPTSIFNKIYKGVIEEEDLVKELFSEGALNKYTYSMSRLLSYDDLYKAYKTGGFDKVKETWLQNFTNEWFNNIVNPHQTQTTPGKIIDWFVQRTYQGKVEQNPWSMLVNYPQTSMARIITTKGARKLEDELFTLTGKYLSGEFKKSVPSDVQKWFRPILDDYNQKIDVTVAPAAGKFKGFIQRVKEKGIFGVSETSNWSRTRAWGRFDELIKSDLYKTEFAKTKDPMKAINNIIKQSKGKGKSAEEANSLLSNAVKRGDAVASETQIPLNPANTPFMLRGIKEYVPVIGKPSAQFMRFNLGWLENIATSFSNRGKLIALWQRGFEPEAKVADSIRSLNSMVRSLEKVKKVKNADDLQPLIDQLKADRTEIWNAVNKTDPRNKAKALLNTTAFLGKSIAMRQFRNYVIGKMFGGTAYLLKELGYWRTARSLKNSPQYKRSPQEQYKEYKKAKNIKKAGMVAGEIAESAPGVAVLSPESALGIKGLPRERSWKDPRAWFNFALNNVPGKYGKWYSQLNAATNNLLNETIASSIWERKK